MLNMCSVNVLFQNAPADLRIVDTKTNINQIYNARKATPKCDNYRYLMIHRPQFEKNWLRKLITLTLPVYFFGFGF